LSERAGAPRLAVSVCLSTATAAASSEPGSAWARRARGRALAGRPGAGNVKYCARFCFSPKDRASVRRLRFLFWQCVRGAEDLEKGANRRPRVCCLRRNPLIGGLRPVVRQSTLPGHVVKSRRGAGPRRPFIQGLPFRSFSSTQSRRLDYSKPLQTGSGAWIFYKRLSAAGARREPLSGRPCLLLVSQGGILDLRSLTAGDRNRNSAVSWATRYTRLAYQGRRGPATPHPPSTA
jgi:hypothetical protein